MNDLTNSDAIKKIDPRNTVGSTEMLLKQAQAAWQQVNTLSVTSLKGQITTIVFCGMGASIYGALVLKALLGEKFPYPSEFISDYHLPSYVNEQTLVILTSYSGTTEEVLSCAEEAKAKNAKMLVVTKGGPLAEFAKTHAVPSYIFDGALNYAGIPRLGAGYTIIGLIGLFLKLELITMDPAIIEKGFQFLESKLPALKQKAMTDSLMFVDTIPVIFSAEHLSGNAQILRNQFNETSKTFSSFFLVPDLNHHLMEGLQFPKDSKLYFIICQSQNYSEKIKKRMALTVDVVKQNNRRIFEIPTSGSNGFEDFLELLTYGSFLTLYLGLRYDQNPAINPWVDYFKEELAK